MTMRNDDPPQRDLIDKWTDYYSQNTAPKLDETHPDPSATIETLWAIARTNIDNGVDIDSGEVPAKNDEERADRAAKWVAAALVVANYGPGILDEFP
jgi:hypothetical protein